MKAQERIYSPNKGVESLTKDEHGLFFDAMQRLGLSNDVKQAAVALYLDFKSRPIGEYNADHKNLEIFLIASVSLAAKAIGDLRTDHEFESRMFVSREKLIDAEERIIRSFGVQERIIPVPDLISQLTKRHIVSMAEGFAERELVSSNEKTELVERSYDYLDTALEKGLNPKMSYRGRAAGVMLKAVRDLGLQISETDIARSAGFDKKSMAINADIIDGLLKDPESSEKNQRLGMDGTPKVDQYVGRLSWDNVWGREVFLTYREGGLVGLRRVQIDLGTPIDTFLSAGDETRAMLNVEKVLKDLNLRIARFGDFDVADVRSLLPCEIDTSEVHRLHREVAAKLGFKIEQPPALLFPMEPYFQREQRDSLKGPSRTSNVDDYD